MHWAPAASPGLYLPSELVEQVLNLIVDNAETEGVNAVLWRHVLCGCSLTCRYWARRCQPLIFVHITIANIKQLNRLLELIQSPLSSIRHYIHDVTLAPPHSERPWIHHVLGKLLPVLPNSSHTAVKLRLQCDRASAMGKCDYCNPRSIYHHLPKSFTTPAYTCPIRSLTLSRLKFQGFLHLLSLVVNLPFLQFLELDKVTWFSDRPKPSVNAWVPTFPMRRLPPRWLQCILCFDLPYCDELSAFCFGFAGIRPSEPFDDLHPDFSSVNPRLDWDFARALAAASHHIQLGVVVQCVSTSVLKIRRGPLRERVSQSVRVGRLCEDFHVFRRRDRVDVAYGASASGARLAPYLVCTFAQRPTSDPDVPPLRCIWEFATITLDFADSAGLCLPTETAPSAGYTSPLSSSLFPSMLYPACDWPQLFTLLFSLPHLTRVDLVFSSPEDWMAFRDDLAQRDCAAVSRGRRPLMASFVRPEEPEAQVVKQAAAMKPLEILERLVAEGKACCGVRVCNASGGTSGWTSLVEGKMLHHDFATHRRYDTDT